MRMALLCGVLGMSANGRGQCVAPTPPGQPRLLPLVIFVPLEVSGGDGRGFTHQDALLPHGHTGALRIRDVRWVCGEDGAGGWCLLPLSPFLSPSHGRRKIISKLMPSSCNSCSLHPPKTNAPWHSLMPSSSRVESGGVGRSSLLSMSTNSAVFFLSLSPFSQNEAMPVYCLLPSSPLRL